MVYETVRVFLTLPICIYYDKIINSRDKKRTQLISRFTGQAPNLTLIWK